MALGAFFSVTTAIVGTSALAQAPTQSQRNAIKSQCRSDYIAHCSSVKPGGVEALQCLQANMAKLAPACQTAVRAVQPPAPAKAEAAPAPKAEPAPAAAAHGETAAPPSSAPSAESAPPAAAVAPPANAAPAASAATAPAATPVKPLVLRPLRPREVVFVLRSACGADVRTLCAGIDPGGGRVLQCLTRNAPSLSPACRNVLSRFAAR